MTPQMIVNTYSEMILFPTFEERFDYLKLDGAVGKSTFGFDRYLNQMFYQRSAEWKRVRNEIIIRDCGCDLGVDGYEIHGRVYIHHINPICADDLKFFNEEVLLNPEYLIATSFNTHNAIHYGDGSLLMSMPVERKPNDTCPWKR